MAENTPKVYDIFHPTPVALKELAAIAVSLEIWRCEVKKFRASDTLKEFDPSRRTISLDTYLPDLPSEIRDQIDGYVKKLGCSIDDWVLNHSGKVIHDNHGSRDREFYYVLKYFDDFVCDYDGSVHYVRTAKRWMQCTSNLFDLNAKFSIACFNFFEKEIKEIWPFVKKNAIWNTIKFSDNPKLYYWICYFKNDFSKIRNRRGDSVAEIMLTKCSPYQRPEVEYFWERIASNGRKRPAKIVFKYGLKSFVRFLLLKLDDQHLHKFVTNNGVELIHALFRDDEYDEQLVVRTWMYVKNHFNQDAFTYLTQKMFETEVLYAGDDFYGTERESDSLAYLSREVWNNAPHDLKQSSIRDILLHCQIFQTLANYLDSDPEPKNAEFVLAILSDATTEDKSSFWQHTWCALIAIYSGKDLQQMMKLCFENDHQITQFKENRMAVSEDVSRHCSKLLSYSHFRKLKDFINFLYPDTKAATDFKRRLLKSAYDVRDFTEENALAISEKLRRRFFKLFHRAEFNELNDFISLLWPEMQEPRIFKQQILRLALLGEDCQFSESFMWRIKQFDEFINDTFNNVDLSNDFKNQLMLSPAVQDCLAGKAKYGSDDIIKFVDLFGLQEQTVQQVKMRIIDALKKNFSETFNLNGREVRSPFMVSQKFLLWCFGNEEEVAKFKLSIGIKPKDQTGTDHMSVDSDSD